MITYTVTYSNCSSVWLHIHIVTVHMFDYIYIQYLYSLISWYLQCFCVILNLFRTSAPLLSYTYSTCSFVMLHKHQFFVCYNTHSPAFHLWNSDILTSSLCHQMSHRVLFYISWVISQHSSLMSTFFYFNYGWLEKTSSLNMIWSGKTVFPIFYLKHYV